MKIIPLFYKAEEIADNEKRGEIDNADMTDSFNQLSKKGFYY